MNIEELFGVNAAFDENYKKFLENNPEFFGSFQIIEKHDNLILAKVDENKEIKITKRYIQFKEVELSEEKEETYVISFYNSIPGLDLEFDQYVFIDNSIENKNISTLNGTQMSNEQIEEFETLKNSLTDKKFVVTEKNTTKPHFIFKSKIKLLEDSLDANQLFEDIEKAIGQLKKELGVGYLGRRHPLQTIINRTSGNYIAPTSMKSFEQSPGEYLYDMLVAEERGTATYNGTSWHNIMDNFYRLSQEERTVEKLWELTEQQIIIDEHDEENANLIRFFTQGYIDAPDYLLPDKKAIDLASEIEVSPEFFAKPAYDSESDYDGSIKPLGVVINIPGGVESTPENYSIPVYNLIDRVDIRNGKLYIIDYKTGAPGDPRDYILGINGYLPQMIYYKWSIEALYGQEVAGVYIMVPGAESLDRKFVEMDVNSLVNQSKVVEKSIEHLKNINEIKKTKIFPIHKTMYRSKLSQWYDLSSYEITRKLPDAPDEIEIELKVRREVYK